MVAKYQWPIVSKSEINIVNKVLKSNKLNYWTGHKCLEFENKFSEYFGLKHAISLANGSVALDIAIKCLELKKDSEIIVTPRSYISSVTSVLNNNLKPVFADIDLNSQNIEAENIKKKITNKTKAILLVHLGGMPCNIDKIISLAKKYKLKIIEDCSQAHGAKIKNKYVGSFGDLAVWSLCNDKILNTLGEGGIIATNNFNYFKKLWGYKDCGKNYTKLLDKKKQFKFRWVHDFEGTNLRMTEIQAAVGIYQLKKLKEWVRKRNLNASRINNICKNFKSITIQNVPKFFYHSYYRNYIFLNFKFIKKRWTREVILKHLNKMGIECDVGSCPEIYREKYLRSKKLNFPKKLKNANFIGNNSISFKVHPDIYKNHFFMKLKKLKSFFKNITIN